MAYNLEALGETEGQTQEGLHIEVRLMNGSVGPEGAGELRHEPRVPIKKVGLGCEKGKAAA